jgi:hypothetical protein
LKGERERKKGFKKVSEMRGRKKRDKEDKYPLTNVQANSHKSKEPVDKLAHRFFFQGGPKASHHMTTLSLSIFFYFFHGKKVVT